MGKIVCVTGASGFIASWLVKQLLSRGYTVRAAVRDPENPVKTGHLLNLPYAKERLELFKADLLEDGSFDSAIDGCDGVFHTASPFFFDTTDPERDLMNPAIKGTLNVLSACTKTNTVKRIVLTSSIAAVIYASSRKLEDIVDESFFSDLEFCQKKKLWYQASKTAAEMEAWKFAKEQALDLVTVNPAMVVGPLLQQTMNTSSEVILKLLNGAPTYPNIVLGWVDVRDVAEAHILVYESPSASGRYLCVDRVAHYEEISRILKDLYPHLPLPSRCADESSPRAPMYRTNTEKLRNLGLKYIGIEESLKACVESLVENNFFKSAI